MGKLADSAATPFLFSQSSLQDYLDCPRRFELKYLDQVRWPAVETAPALENERRQIEGQLFHRMVQQYYLGLPIDKISKYATSADLRRWWGNFFIHRPEFADHELSTEATLSLPVNHHRLIAKFDLMALKPGDNATIIDWKTYRNRPSRKWMANRLQTQVYLALLLRLGQGSNNKVPYEPGQIEMIYWYAEFPDQPEIFKWSQNEHDRVWNNLLNLINEIESKQSFPMTENEKLCSYCTFRSFCERGVSAGEGEESEKQSLVDDFNFDQIQEIEF